LSVQEIEHVIFDNLILVKSYLYRNYKRLDFSADTLCVFHKLLCENLFEEAGKLKELKEQWRQKIQENFKRPKSVDGIISTVEARSFHHDPTLVIEHDIQTPKGDYLARKGDRLNPILVMKPEKGFLFINGEDTEQIDFAKQHFEHFEHFDVVLVAGSPLDVESQLKVPVFFDQGGYLIGHYGIKQVPALLSVDHNLLLIREVKPNA